MTHDYDDIILLPHHVSSTRPRMPLAARAAQFAPFAALSGHGEALARAGNAHIRGFDKNSENNGDLDASEFFD